MQHLKFASPLNLWQVTPVKHLSKDKIILKFKIKKTRFWISSNNKFPQQIKFTYSLTTIAFTTPVTAKKNQYKQCTYVSPKFTYLLNLFLETENNSVKNLSFSKVPSIPFCSHNTNASDANPLGQAGFYTSIKHFWSLTIPFLLLLK